MSNKYTEPIINKQNKLILQQAEIVDRLTNKDDLIVVGTDDPSLLNATHRIGWRIMNSIPDNNVTISKTNARHHMIRGDSAFQFASSKPIKNKNSPIQVKALGSSR
ncbi:hypothetical protein [Paenibacillus phytorum]|nr:hypothetical protein [Paenibacillus phytorum]